jgi:ABC-type uncharacterized transport system substrate-binding protein
LEPRSPWPAAGRTPAPLAKKWNLDILEYVNVLDVEEAERGVRAGLRDAGVVEGRDCTVRVRNAQGDMPTLSTMVDAALSDVTDLMITLSTPTLQAALRRAQSVPIVFTFVADAVAAGAGRSDTDHLPNVTGVPTTAAYEELIDLVRTCLPAARRIGTLFVPAEVNSVYNKEQLERAATHRGLELVAVAANTSAEVSDATLALLAQNVDAVCQAGGNLTTSAFASIAQPARRARVPVFGFLTGDVHTGAAVDAARDYFDGGREAGLIASRILRGESPATIPFRPRTPRDPRQSRSRARCRLDDSTLRAPEGRRDRRKVEDCRSNDGHHDTTGRRRAGGERHKRLTPTDHLTKALKKRSATVPIASG